MCKIRKFDYKIVYKLHPFEVFSWYKDYPWLAESKIEIADHQGKQLYRLFAESEVQVGVYSTALFEGLSFGVKTFLVDLPGIDYMEDLLEWKVATQIKRPKELLDFLEDSECKQCDSEMFFKSESIQNIRNALEHIIEST